MIITHSVAISFIKFMTEFVRVSLLFGRTGIFEIQQIRERKGNARVQERVLGRPARYAAPLSSAISC